MKSLDEAAGQISFLMDQFVAAMELDLSCQILTHPNAVPEVTIQFFGSDVGVLTSNERELLNALEVLSAEIRAADRLDLISCSIVEP